MLKKLKEMFSAKQPEVFKGMRALVAVITDSDTSPLTFTARDDYTVLNKYYRNAQLKTFTTPHEMLTHARQQKYDYCHILLKMNEKWDILSTEPDFPLQEVINELATHSKWIWIAGEYEFERHDLAPNSPRGCHFVLTKQRNSFSRFYGDILRAMSGGKSLPAAWLQPRGGVSGDTVPVSTMSPGLGELIFLP